jgi:hypothetical protein
MQTLAPIAEPLLRFQILSIFRSTAVHLMRAKVRHPTRGGRNVIKSFIFAATAVTMLAGATLSAEAMPAAPSNSISMSSDQSGLTLVAGGCGLGFHRGPYGGCRPNFGPRRIYGPRRFYAPRRCFVRRGPYGGVRRICR